MTPKDPAASPLHFFKQSYVLYTCSFALCLVSLLYRLMRGKSTDPYGDFHLKLNKLPGEQEDAPPRTEWLNMGYWKDTDVFPEACRALALKLTKAAQMKPNARVLDVGHGSGESLVALLGDPSFPTPSHLTGITSLPAHHARSAQRISELNLSEKTTLYLGDAVYDPKALKHPLNRADGHQYEHVLALDCAYHFRTRDEFLRQCHACLVPGGRVALADLCISREWASLSLMSRILLTVLKIMPRDNCVSIEEYEARMRKMGYKDVEVEDITEDVFPGFLGFLRGRGVAWFLFAKLFAVNAPSLRFVVAAGTR